MQNYLIHVTYAIVSTHIVGIYNTHTSSQSVTKDPPSNPSAPAGVAHDLTFIHFT